MRSPWVVVFVCYSVGCAVEPPAAPVTAVEAAIVGGEPLERGQFPAVVAIVLATGGVCTGTLISPSRVLTAAHCLTPTPPGVPDDAAVARQIQVYVDAIHVCGPDQAARRVPVARIARHPDYGFPPPRHDIGVVVLAEPLMDRAPLPINRRPEVPATGELITVVGYGVSDGVTQQGCEGHSAADVPAGTGPCAAAMPEFQATFVSLDQAAGRGTCLGDSGGPYLARVDGALTVVGVVSAGSVDCGGLGYGPRTAGELEFIDHALAGRFGFCRPDGACEPDCPADPDCGDAAVPDGGAVDAGFDAAPAFDGGGPSGDGPGGAVDGRGLVDEGRADAAGPAAVPGDPGCRAALDGGRMAGLWLVFAAAISRRRLR